MQYWWYKPQEIFPKTQRVKYLKPEDRKPKEGQFDVSVS
jgi:hypothetical protein